jgi:hypothetical protein
MTCFVRKHANEKAEKKNWERAFLTSWLQPPRCAWSRRRRARDARKRYQCSRVNLIAWPCMVYLFPHTIRYLFEMCAPPFLFSYVYLVAIDAKSWAVSRSPTRVVPVMARLPASTDLSKKSILLSQNLFHGNGY